MQMFISVVTAVYNGEDYLMECIESILNQTYKDFEYIIVNDGSTDKTREILDSITDNRVIVIHSETNQGAAHSLNIGIEKGRGEWIAIQDADDVSKATKLEEQAKCIQKNPHVVGIASLIKCIPGKGYVPDFQLEGMEKGYNRQLNREEIFKNRFHSCYLCHGTVMFSKEAFNRVGKYNPSYKISYDYDLWLRLFTIMPIEKLPNVLYEYRVVTNSLTNSNGKEVNKELLRIATTYIHQIVHDRIGREPKLAVIGSRLGCDFFEENVTSVSRISVYDYFSIGDSRKEYKLAKLIKSRAIDGVMVMDDKQAHNCVARLVRKGLKINENIFHIWNHEF